MNPIVFAMRRPVKTLMLVVMLVGSGILGCSKIGAGTFPPLNTAKVYMYLHDIGTNAKQVKAYIAGQVESYFQKHEEQSNEEARKIVATCPKATDVVITQPYVCQIRSQRHIEVRALVDGYLEEIKVGEGQAVKKNDVMFKIRPILYEARLNAEVAEAQYAQREYDNTKMLFDQKMVSDNELTLLAAKLAKAKAKAQLARAELDFTSIRAPFDGIVDRLAEREGSLIKERDILTTLSDNSVMWVYFNVPEARYLEYMASLKQENEEQKIELVLANHNKFPQIGKIGAIEAKFNNETGNIPFRADFKNPNGLLRHGQTGTILIHRILHDALVIPQRATFERLDKRYVWVVGQDDVVHQSLITIKHELDDVFVVNSGLDVKDKIVLEGVREVQEGAKVECEFRTPELALSNQKFHAE